MICTSDDQNCALGEVISASTSFAAPFFLQLRRLRLQAFQFIANGQTPHAHASAIHKLNQPQLAVNKLPVAG